MGSYSRDPELNIPDQRETNDRSFYVLLRNWNNTARQLSGLKAVSLAQANSF